MLYTITIKTPIDMRRTYHNNERRDLKGFTVKGEDAMLSKVAELKRNGATIYSVYNEIGNRIHITEENR